MLKQENKSATTPKPATFQTSRTLTPSEQESLRRSKAKTVALALKTIKVPTE